MDRSQVDPVFRRIAARAAGDDEVIAGLERVDRETGLFEARRIGPFGRNLLPLPVLVDGGQVEPRVRILQLEGDDIAFESNLLLLEIVRGKRVVG